MLMTPYDINEAIEHRRQYAEDALREGSPVVGVSYGAGMLLLTVRRTQRKIFEIYDRILFGAVGHQADVEAIRVGAIDVAHREGFDRSPDDVTVHRLVSFSLSPPLKALFGDPYRAPAVVRALFGEMGAAPEADSFYLLGYDGEYERLSRRACAAGAVGAETRARDALDAAGATETLEAALDSALRAWGEASAALRTRGAADGGEPTNGGLVALREALTGGAIEAGVLDRGSQRESKFRLLAAHETAAAAGRVV